MNKKKLTKTTAKGILSVALALALLTTGMVTAVAAAEPNTPKQEIVYINLNTDGSVAKVYVVNTFALSEDGKIIDYGDYSSLRNMTSDERIVFEDETVTIDTKAGTLYYEGVLSDNAIPWDFSLRYYLNNAELSADELAGKSGALKIKMNVRENTDCDSPFFENYALQASVTLDTRLCKNILAPDATTANVGRNKQLTYTILPGKGANVEISADVTDFEMDGIAINGVPLSMSLDVEFEDSEEIDEAIEGMEKLDDGANELSDGAAELRDGASALSGGASALNSGAQSLTGGAATLTNGAANLQNGASALQNGAGALLGGGQAVQQGSQEMRAGLSELSGKAPQLVTGSTALDNGLSEAMAGASDLASGAKGLETGANEAKTGAESLSGGLATLSAQSGELVGGAYAVFVSLTTQATAQINQSLSAMGIPAISLTPENYSSVLTGLLQALGSGAGSAAPAPSTTGPETPAAPEEPALQAIPEIPREPALPGAPAGEGDATPEGPAAEAPTAPVGELPADLTPEAAEPEGPAAEIEALEIVQDAPLVLNVSTGSAEPSPAAPAASGNAQGSAQAILAIKAQLDAYQQFYLGLKNYTDAVGAASVGADGLRGGVNALAQGASALQAGASALYDGISVLKSGSSEMLAGLNELQNGSGTLLEGAIRLENGTVQLQSGIVSLSDGTVALLDGANALYDGAISLYGGTLTLNNGCAEVLGGAIALYDGSVSLYDGTLELKGGTMEFRDKTADIGTTINDKITTAFSDMMGTDFEPVSFVSSKNTNIEFVQFVAKTEAIEKTEAVAAAAPEEAPLNAWQKFLHLFGL